MRLTTQAWPRARRLTRSPSLDRAITFSAKPPVRSDGVPPNRRIAFRRPPQAQPSSSTNFFSSPCVNPGRGAQAQGRVDAGALALEELVQAIHDLARHRQAPRSIIAAPPLVVVLGGPEPAGNGCTTSARGRVPRGLDRTRPIRSESEIRSEAWRSGRWRQSSPEPRGARFRLLSASPPYEQPGKHITLVCKGEERSAANPFLAN